MYPSRCSIAAYTLSGGPWAIISDAGGPSHNIIRCTSWNARERIGHRRVYYTVYIILILCPCIFSPSLSQSPPWNSHGWRGPSLKQPSSLYAHIAHSVPETFPQSYFKLRPALDHHESRSFPVFPRRRCAHNTYVVECFGFFPSKKCFTINCPGLPKIIN